VGGALGAQEALEGEQVVLPRKVGTKLKPAPVCKCRIHQIQARLHQVFTRRLHPGHQHGAGEQLVVLVRAMVEVRVVGGCGALIHTGFDQRVGIEEQHVGASLFRVSHEPGQRVGVPVVVAVEKAQVSTAGFGETTVARHRLPGVLLSDEPEARVLLRRLLQQLR
jgi:hypothetical protein